MKVLIADDEVKVCKLLVNLVDWASLGLEIVGIANDGHTACSMIETLKPDIVITDIRMPGFNGIELIDYIKKRFSQIHFIIISGYRQFEYASQAIKYGVEDYLLKPLKKTEIERVLKKIINDHEQVVKSSRAQEDMMRKMVQSIGLLQNHFLKLLTDREAFETENLSLQKANEIYHLPFCREGFKVVLVEVTPKSWTRFMRQSHCEFCIGQGLTHSIFL